MYRNAETSIPPRSERLESRMRRFLENDPELAQFVIEGLKAQDAMDIDGLRQLKNTNPEAYEKIIAMAKFRREIARFLEHNNLERETNPKSKQQLFVMHTVEQFLLNSPLKDTTKLMGHIEQPPGTGKTREMIMIAELAHKAGLKVLIITPKLDINHQTHTEIIKGSGAHEQAYAIPSSDIAVNDSVHEPNYRSPVQISSYQSLEKLLASGYNPDLIIRDEMHRSLAEHTNSVTNIFSAAARVTLGLDSKKLERIYKTPQIGFSATPFIAGRKAEDLGFTLIHRQSIPAAIKGGYEAHELFTDSMDVILTTNGTRVNKYGEPDFIIEDTRDNNQRLTQKYNEEYQWLLTQLIRQGKLQENDVENYPPAYRYTNSVAHATTDAQAANTMFHHPCDFTKISKPEDLDHLLATSTDNIAVFAMPLSHKTPPRLRRKIFDLYRQRHIKVLCGKNVLDEGVDTPNAQVGHLPPTKSPTVYIQRVGRLLRQYTAPDGTEKVSIIFDTTMPGKDTITMWDIWSGAIDQFNASGTSFAEIYRQRLTNRDREGKNPLTIKEQKYLTLCKQVLDTPESYIGGNVILGENAAITKHQRERNNVTLDDLVLNIETHALTLRQAITKLFETEQVRQPNGSMQLCYKIPIPTKRTQEQVYQFVPRDRLIPFLKENLSDPKFQRFYNKQPIMLPNGSTITLLDLCSAYAQAHRNANPETFFDALGSEKAA